jgi:hypothetical protein
MHTCNSALWEAESKTSLGYIVRPCLKATQEKERGEGGECRRGEKKKENN